jgi:hypothetical protein
MQMLETGVLPKSVYGGDFGQNLALLYRTHRSENSVPIRD